MEFQNEMTRVARYLPELISLCPLESDEPLLPLVPEAERREGDYLREGMVVG